MDEGLITVRGTWSLGDDMSGWRVFGIHLLAGAVSFGIILLTTIVPAWALAPMAGLVIAVILFISVPTEYFRRHGPIVRRVEVALDDAGLRVSIGSSSRYHPIADVNVALEPSDEPHELRVPGSLFRLGVAILEEARPAAKALAAALERRRARLTPEDDHADLAALRRGDDPLEAWSSRVLEHVAAERRTGQYRAAGGFDDERLRDLLSDVTLAPNLRAAAGHALVRLAPGWIPELVPAITSAPPIVVAMLSAGAGDALRGQFLVVAPFLSRRDRRAAEHLARAPRAS